MPARLRSLMQSALRYTENPAEAAVIPGCFAVNILMPKSRLMWNFFFHIMAKSTGSEEIRSTKGLPLRGGGTTTQKADALLELPDGREAVTKTSEVTKEVEKIIGLSKDQFTQIAMRAQGGYMKLLLSDTTERSKIFRQIFMTGRYQRLQEILKKEANKAENDYKFKSAIATEKIAQIQVRSEDQEEQKRFLECSKADEIEAFIDDIDKEDKGRS